MNMRFSRRTFSDIIVVTITFFLLAAIGIPLPVGCAYVYPA